MLPADVAGVCELTVPKAAGQRRFRVRFTQHYQRVSGTASADGRTVRLGGARLTGDSLEFQISERAGATRTILRFAGRVSGAGMSGTVRSDPGSVHGTWRAVRRP